MIAQKYPLLSVDDCLVVVVDVQEKLFPAMAQGVSMVGRIQILLQVAQILSVPVIFSEQYRQGLGGTVKSLTPYIPPEGAVEKTRFSCAGVAEFDQRLRLFGRSCPIIVGIESHICVLQTALELAQREGIAPIVMADGVTSRLLSDKEAAIKRCCQYGVEILSLEMIVFEFLRDAKDQNFRNISNLIK